MAQAQRNNLARYRRYFRKKLRTSFGGLAPSAILGRITGPRILINSVPKAGTHLVEAILDLAPGVRNAGARTLNCWSGLDAKTERSLRSIRRGQYRTAHLPGLNAVFEAIGERDIKALFVVRDPRDVAISRYHYIRDIDLTHPAHQLFEGLSDHEALKLSIAGSEPEFASIGTLVRAFAPWLGSGALTLHFEKLSPKIVTPDDLTGEIATIFAYLGLDSAASSRVATNLVSQTTSTLRKGLARQWVKEFDDEHLELFKNTVPDDLMRAYGYSDV